MPRRRRVALLILVLAIIGVPVTAGWAYWSGIAGQLKGPGVAGASSVNGGALPTAANAGGTSATVRWGASTLANSVAVTGYTIRRYSLSSGVESPVGAGCSGIVKARICTETGIAVGSWRYTVTPVVGSHWTGTESARSGAVSVADSSLILAQRVFAAPLPAQTTGTVSGMAPSEHITYSLGPADSNATVSGSPSTVGADGSVTITALTVPDLPDGPHSIHVTGSDSGAEASAAIVIDTTPPVVTPNLTPVPNAAGWNRTPVEADGSASDGSGSGVDFVKATADGSDPRTSPTALVDPSPGTITESLTIKVFAQDVAGNQSAVVTIPVKIDMVPPTGVVDMTELTGGAVVEASGTVEAPGFAYYRGSAAGSFRLRIAMSDTGGSGPGTLATSSLVDVATGWTHVSGATESGGQDVYLTNPFAWVAGTTSTPTGSASMTDVAGNTTVIAGALVNDSTPPAGGSVHPAALVGTGSRYATSTTVHLTLDPGADAGSGLAATGAQLMRASATLSSSAGVANGTCGSYGTRSVVATDPGTTAADVVPTDDRCYQYSYLVPDKVGNVATDITQDIKVEAAPPASLTPTAAQILPLTGVAAQYVSGTTLYYVPLQTGSFSVATSVSDSWSGIANVGFPVLGGFSGGGSVTTPTSGTTFKATYSWSNNSASASPGTLTLTVTDNAGFSQSTVLYVVRDDTGPTHAPSLTGATGAYLAGTTLWYRPTASGTFKLVDAAADDGSGTASVAFPNLGLSGWKHAAETVTTPSGGPFTSSAFSWTSYPSSPGTYVITGMDRLGTATTTAITFTQDQSPPSGVSIGYSTASIVTTASVPLTLTQGSDGGAGVNAASGIVKRDQATLNTGTNNCGSFPGSFSTTVTPVGGADTSVTTGHCYRYRYLVSDNVGNQATSSSGNSVKVKIP